LKGEIARALSAQKEAQRVKAEMQVLANAQKAYDAIKARVDRFQA